MIKVEKFFNFPISKKLVYWIIAPLAIILIAGIMFGIYTGVYKDVNKGMNIGIDFAGGSLVTVQLGNIIATDDAYNEYEKLISDAIENEEIGTKVAAYAVSSEYSTKFNGSTIELPDSAASANITYAQSSGSDEELAIVFKYDNVSSTYDKDNTLSAYRNELIKTYVADVLATKLTDYDYDEIEDMIIYENIGATASAELITTALLCLGVSLAIILLYIIIRFEIWSGLAAVIALLHDVLMLVALTIIFHIQVNSAFVAAIITIVSYSINNTIVVFDRLRENLKKEQKLNVKFDKALLIDKSVRQTALRSINSTATTMVTIVIFAIFGSSTVNEFALPVIFGLVAGFYSSMFLAPSLYYSMLTSWEKNKLEKANNSKVQKPGSKPKYIGAK